MNRARDTRYERAVVTRKEKQEKSREKILEAATTEFSSQGFGGARVDAIARRADTNKRMLYHYFGNKEALYTAVLEKAYADIRNHEKDLDLDHLEPREAITKLVAFNFDYFVDNPEFIRLLYDENLYNAEHIRKSGRIRAMHSPLIKQITEVVKRGQQAGQFRADIDPMQLYISIAGLGYFYFSNASTLGAIFGRKMMTPAALKKRFEHVSDVVIGYLSHQ